MDKDEIPSEYPMVCCFCDEKITHVRQRHNAQPIMDSWCCETCNATKVIPYRMRVLGAPDPDDFVPSGNATQEWRTLKLQDVVGEDGVEKIIKCLDETNPKVDVTYAVKRVRELLDGELSEVLSANAVEPRFLSYLLVNQRMQKLL